MPSKCLLCGYAGEEAAAATAFYACSWCRPEALLLKPQEADALEKMEEIQPQFRVWSRGRREDSDAKRQRAPEPQPARLYPGLPLYVGDMDDAADVQRLRELGVGCVVTLCAERLAPGHGYEMVPSSLVASNMNFLALFAEDNKRCDIVKVAEQAFAAIAATLDRPAGQNGVLVHCWGGVNRSVAVAVAFLTSQRGVPLLAAVSAAMATRGTVLTNQSFRKQLVQYCSNKALPLEGVVPPALLEAPAVGTSASQGLDTILGMCNDRSGRGHRPVGEKDTSVYGLLFAARDGCLTCVTNYIEERGVPVGSCSDTRKYTAMDWAKWELSRMQTSSTAARKRQLESVVLYLEKSSKNLSACEGLAPHEVVDGELTEVAGIVD